MYTIKTIPFYLFTFSIIILLTGPFLIQDGMFMDGQQYACVAENMANGKGTFWFPIVNDTWIMLESPFFLEHPPLFYWLESFAFLIFGNSMYTERLFSFLMIICNLVLIHLVYEYIARKNNFSLKYSWLPMLLWIIIPVCFWAFQNNMIEITLSVFTLLSILFSLKAILEEKFCLLYCIASGLFLFLALLTKGLPGLFPLTTIPLYYLIFKKKSFIKSIGYTLTIFSIPLMLLFIIILINDSARESLHFYFYERLLNRISNTENEHGSFYILFLLLSELLIPIILTILLFFISKKKNFAHQNFSLKKKYAVFFILLGLFGSAPIAFTPVQKNFYFVASLPCFAIGFSYLNIDFITYLISGLKSLVLNRLKYISFILLIGSFLITFSQIGNTSREQDKLSDVRYLGGYLTNEQRVGVDNNTYFDWSFQFYIYRKFKINLDPRNRSQKFIIKKPESSKNLVIGYKKIELPLKTYELYKKIGY